jgi:hypothetical protein
MFAVDIEHGLGIADEQHRLAQPSDQRNNFGRRVLLG